MTVDQQINSLLEVVEELRKVKQAKEDIRGVERSPTAGVGQRLKSARLEKRLSLREVEKMLGGLTHTTIANYELCRTDPRLGDLKALAEIYGVSLAWLVGLGD
jgi:hypothetical protein